MLTVVTGPPCSGKSTYVRTHARPGDIIIDFDLLAQAFGSSTPHDHTAPVRHVTIQARRTAIAAAITVSDKVDVWIVDCNISPERHGAYQRAGAHIVRVDASPEELHRRANAERPHLWHRLIDQWQPIASDAQSSREW
jgi:hypothetical protein